MKKTLVFVLGLMLVSSAVLAAGDTGMTMSKKIELGVNAGIGIPTNSGYDLGFGGQVIGLYRVDENLGIGLGIGYNTFSVTGSTSSTGASSADLSFLAMLKYAFGTDKTKPYILVDAGLSDFMDSITISGISLSGSSIYPEIGGGVGVQFPAGQDANLFLQATVNAVLGSGSTFTYIPIYLGVNFDI